ncbi:MAG: 3-phosphoshikimate 1-carboxyvinyltransferase [Bacteroidaceae bacterium]|nr:3-phosphoshikimate 1-carboxyvinyltransferase [Bacteroidaceae bacterium]
MILEVSGTVSGNVQVPPSKSVAHRMLICAALADAPCTIVCQSVNRDMEATAACLNALGANITYADGKFSVTPITKVQKGVTLDCGESGSTLRFLLPVAAALGADATFIGHGRLPERPLSPLYEEMTAHGVKMSPNGHMPLKCEGNLPAGLYTIDGGVSSQFISGLLMALPLTGIQSKIVITGKQESASYIGLTLNALSQFGIEIQTVTDGFIIPSGQEFTSADTQVAVEGDWSAAAFWITAGVAGSKPVTCTGLDYERSAQGDRRIVDVLRKMGADIATAGNTVTARPSNLTAAQIDCADIPDLVPILAVAASSAQGTTIFDNIRRLRIKESDRVQSILQLLGMAGIYAFASDNTLTVTGGPARNCSYDPSGDHRMAMAAAILASNKNVKITISDAECVAKSYPAFFDDFNALGGGVRVEN